jgi:hypothetical protein
MKGEFFCITSNQTDDNVRILLRVLHLIFFVSNALNT